MWTNRIFDQMDRLLGPLGFDGPNLTAPAPAYPPLSVWEDENALYVEAEMPGTKLDDIEVSVAEGDQLTIAGEREPCSPAGNWLHQERAYGEFTRTITLPVDVDTEGIEAQYEDGVLTITLPKSEAVKPRRIPIKASTPALTA